MPNACTAPDRSCSYRTVHFQARDAGEGLVLQPMFTRGCTGPTANSQMRRCNLLFAAHTLFLGLLGPCHGHRAGNKQQQGGRWAVHVSNNNRNNSCASTLTEYEGKAKAHLEGRNTTPPVLNPSRNCAVFAVVVVFRTMTLRLSEARA